MVIVFNMYLIDLQLFRLIIFKNAKSSLFENRHSKKMPGRCRALLGKRRDRDSNQSPVCFIGIGFH